MRIDGFKDGGAEIVFFRKMTKFQQGGGIWHGRAGKNDSRKSTHGLAVINGIFQSFIVSVITLLKGVEAQHAVPANGWTTGVYHWDEMAWEQ